MKVGDKVWLFSLNRRVYPKTSTGIGISPIYSEHFYQDVIDSETSRSWIIGRDKFSKKDPKGIYTDEQKQEAIWEHDNRRRIKELFESCSIEKLHKIDEILKERD